MYTSYLLSIFVFFGLCLLISGMTFHLSYTPFSFQSTWISELGDPTKNIPIGFILFDIGFILTSLGLLPVIYNLYHRLTIFKKGVRMTISIMLLIGSLSFGSIGILHDQIQPIHDVFSGIAFSTISIALIILWLSYLFSALLGSPKKNVIAISLSIGQLVLFWILLFAIPVRNNIEFSNYAPWEWIGTFSIILAIILCLVFLPEKDNEIEIEKAKK